MERAQWLFTGQDRMVKSLGRPRGFDVADAIGKAQDLFWQRGFEATSLATLAAAIGVHKPSLYAAYGDKRDLYLAAYDAYQQDAEKLVVDAFGRSAFRDALIAFFAADIDLFMAGDGRGCFMLATAVPLAQGDEQIGSRVRAALAALRQAVEVRVRQAGRDGHLAKMDVATATDLIMSTHIALATRARSGEPRAPLEQTAARLIAMLCRS